MRNFLRVVFFLVLILSFSELRASTLLESLNLAYLNNPKLNAERANMRASKEEKTAGFFFDTFQ